MALIFLLGLTWTFGLLWIDRESVIFAYIFTVLNSLQGLFIFLFHVAFNERVSNNISILKYSVQIHKQTRRWLRRSNCLPMCMRNYALDSNQRHNVNGYIAGSRLSSSNADDGSSPLPISSSNTSGTEIVVYLCLKDI